MPERKYGTLSDAQKEADGKKSFSDRQKEVIYKMQQLVGFNKADKLGTYAESTGGGDVLTGTGNKEKGNFVVVDNAEQAEEQREKNPNVKVRYNQPRDEDGQFASNAVNLRETKYPGRAKRESDAFRGTDIEKAINSEGKIEGTRSVSGGGVNKSNLSIDSQEDLVDMSNDWAKFSERVLGANIVRQKGRRSKEATEMLKKGKEGFLRTDPKKINQWRDQQGKIFKKKGEEGNKNPKQDNDSPGKVQNEAKKTENKTQENVQSGGKIDKKDVDLAKNNPKEFMTKYQSQMKEVTDLAKQKGKKISYDAIVALVAEGKTDVFERIKDSLK